MIYEIQRNAALDVEQLERVASYCSQILVNLDYLILEGP